MFRELNFAQDCGRVCHYCIHDQTTVHHFGMFNRFRQYQFAAAVVVLLFVHEQIVTIVFLWQNRARPQVWNT